MTTDVQQLILTSSTSIGWLSQRTIELDGNTSPVTNQYLIKNGVNVICDTTTFGSVFVRLTPGNYTNSGVLVSNENQYVVVKSTGTGTVTITPLLGYTINGAASYVVASNNMVKLLLFQGLNESDVFINDWVIIGVGSSTVPGAKIPSIASSTTNAIVRWSGALGDTFNNSLITIDNFNNITIPVALNVTGSLFTGTSALSAATNTVIGTVTGAAPNNTSLLMGGSITGPLTTLVGSVIAVGNSTSNRLAALTDSTDSIILTNFGFSTTTTVTNSILWSGGYDFTGAITNALIIGGGNTGLTNTAFGTRVTVLGTLGSTAPLVLGDDTMLIRPANVQGDRPSLRSICIGRGGLIEKAHTAATADIIYLASSPTATMLTTTDNRVIAVGTSVNTVQNSLDTVFCGNCVSGSFLASTNFVSIVSNTSNTANTTNTDCVLIGNNIALTSATRSVVFSKGASFVTLSNFVNVTSMTPGTAIAPDVTKAGILCMSSMAATGLDNTGFGYTVATGLTGGDNNVMVGTDITSGTNTATTVALGTTLTADTGTTQCVLIGNGLVINGSDDNSIAIGAGTITTLPNRLFLGTATNTINVTTTVGAAGAAAAPVAPAQYMRVIVNNVAYRVPLFNQA
jgi:hypothetical protein